MAAELRILLVDDDEDDLTLIQTAAESISDRHSLCTARGAEKAIRLLREKAQNHEVLPNLILVDLNMPGMDGFEFLEWLRREATFCTLPAIVLSGSFLCSDIDKAYRSGARGYVTKPCAFEDLVIELSSLFSFWSCCVLPNPSPS